MELELTEVIREMESTLTCLEEIGCGLVKSQIKERSDSC